MNGALRDLCVYCTDRFQRLHRPGTILRFTALQDSSEDVLRAAGRPLPPLSAAGNKNYVQGNLLELREGQLIVAFDEKVTWPIGDEEYRYVQD